jgi:hypothetical protein
MSYYWLLINLVPRACDPWEGNEGSGIIRYRKPRILTKIELRIPFQWPIRFLPETDYPRAFVSFLTIAGSGNEIGCWCVRCYVFINLVPRLSSLRNVCVWSPLAASDGNSRTLYLHKMKYAQTIPLVFPFSPRFSKF